MPGLQPEVVPSVFPAWGFTTSFHHKDWARVAQTDKRRPHQQLGRTPLALCDLLNEQLQYHLLSSRGAKVQQRAVPEATLVAQRVKRWHPTACPWFETAGDLLPLSINLCNLYLCPAGSLESLICGGGGEKKEKIILPTISFVALE